MKKILIICAGLQLGGAEKVSADISLYAPEDLEFHYLVFEGYRNDYGAEITKKGNKVFVWPSPSLNYFRYICRLNRLIRKNKYSAVHSHTMFNSGINMFIAKLNRVPVRISHSHTTKTETVVPIMQKIYEAFMRMLIACSSTDYFACGKAAGRWLFGKRLFDKRGTVVRNGIDTELFKYSPSNRETIRKHLNIDDDTFVIGHSGTLLPLKNQAFLIRLMTEICKEIPNAKLLLLGRGDQKNRDILKKEIADNKMEKNVILYGETSHVDQFLSAFDLFVLPSLREGTPLALIEAQANGLPCIVSDRVPGDAFITDLVQTVPLETQEWKKAILSVRRHNSSEYASFVKFQGFDVHDTYKCIYDSYDEKRSLPKGIVTLSFDDGRKDNYLIAKKILKTLNIPATFNITTGYVDGNCPVKLRPSKVPAMSVEEVKSLGKEPIFEMALHGNNHLNTLEDIAEGREKLMDWLCLANPYLFGFASPGSNFDLTDTTQLEKEPFQSGISYIRSSMRYNNMKHLRILARKAARVIHWPVLYKFAYADTLMSPYNGRILYSVPIMGDITEDQVIALVDLCIKKKQALILMFHSIEEFPNDLWSWDIKRFHSLCHYIYDQREKGNLIIKNTVALYDLIK